MTGHGEENGLEHVKASELYPRKSLVSSDPSLQVPFPELPGEFVEYLAKTTDGVIALSNYRLFVRFKESFVNRPLGLIESVEYRDIFFIYVCCKDAHSFRCTFETNEACLEWYNRLGVAITLPNKIDSVFAFAFHAYCRDNEEVSRDDSTQNLTKLATEAKKSGGYSFDKEVERLQFDLKNPWRITHINQDFKVCQSYPKLHIVPKKVSDEDLKHSASFRGGRRFPSIVWRNVKNGAVIARCSQPEVGWLGWRNTTDEMIMRAIADACTSNVEDSKDKPKSSMVIVDARSYAAAVANRAKGGGCECIEYYPNCDIQFMSLANIHAIRKSFHAVRSLCSTGGDQTGWLQGLDTTKWLQHLSSLLKATVTVVQALDREARPVLVHCSDGWDRTPQITALAQLLLDPYYRTLEGFRVLVEKEWLEFGHKFADRCGLGKCTEDTNERCPVFLQWLDAVHQLLLQSPRAFQFNQSYLVKLAQHTYSNLFGTFLCNSTRDRQMEKVYEQTSTVWGLLHPKNRPYFNPLYIPDQDQVLEPSYHLKDLHLWRAVYMYKTPPSAALEENFEGIPLDEDTPSENQDTQVLTKTRSCENLSAVVETATHSRRLSDPNVIISDPMDSHLATIMNGNADNSEQQKSTEEIELKTEQQNGVPNGEINGKCEDGESCAVTSSENVVTSQRDVNGVTSQDVENPSETQKLENSELSKNEAENNVIPLSNGNEITAEMISRNSTSTGSDTTLYSGDPEIAEDQRTLCGSITDSTTTKQHENNSSDENSIKNSVMAETTDKGKTSGDNTIVMNGHCDTLKKCSISEQQTSTENGELLKNENCDKAAVNCNGHVINGHLHNGDADARTSQFGPKQLNLKSQSEILNGEVTHRNVVGENGFKYSPPTRNILHIRAANMSTSTSDISDSHVHVNIKTNFVTGIVKANSLKEEDQALMKLEIGDRAQKRRLQLDVNNGGLSRECSREGGSHNGSNHHMSTTNSLSSTPSPSIDRSSGSWVSRPANGVSRFLDVDGLNVIEEPVTSHVLNLHAYYATKLRRQQRVINTLLYHLTSGGGKNGAAGKCPDDFMLMNFEEEEEAGSLGAHSNAASDVSWEQVTEQDADMTLWVPDHVVTHCAGCDSMFWVARRKHHCRNCGQVFCGECANFYVPVPRQQLKDPVRVCRTCYVTMNGDLISLETIATDTESEINSAMEELTVA